MGVLSDADFFTYTSWFHSVTDRGSGFIGGIRPTALFYIKCSPETCLDRISNRDRKGESQITLDYLQKLHEAHEKYANDSKQDGSGYDLVNIVDVSLESKPTHTYYNNDSRGNLDQLMIDMHHLLG
jgi:deoxyadenosine/deoxycytidine kinase